MIYNTKATILHKDILFGLIICTTAHQKYVHHMYTIFTTVKRKVFSRDMIDIQTQFVVIVSDVMKHHCYD